MVDHHSTIISMQWRGVSRSECPWLPYLVSTRDESQCCMCLLSSWCLPSTGRGKCWISSIRLQTTMCRFLLCVVGCLLYWIEFVSTFSRFSAKIPKPKLDWWHSRILPLGYMLVVKVWDKIIEDRWDCPIVPWPSHSSGWLASWWWCRRESDLAAGGIPEQGSLVCNFVAGTTIKLSSVVVVK